VAIFVAELAFDDVALTESAKLGILGATAVAGAAGYFVLPAVSPSRRGEAPSVEV